MDNPVDLLLELLTHDGWGYQPKSTISDFSPWVYINVIMGCQSTPKRRRCLRYMELDIVLSVATAHAVRNAFMSRRSVSDADVAP